MDKMTHISSLQDTFINKLIIKLLISKILVKQQFRWACHTLPIYLVMTKAGQTSSNGKASFRLLYPYSTDVEATKYIYLFLSP